LRGSFSTRSSASVKVSVVIPAYNEEKLLLRTLQSVNAARAGFADQGWDSELIVCNNNSTDRTAEIAAAGGATVVFEAINQIGRARNTGAAAATGDWVLFVDADSRPTRQLFADAVLAAASGRAIAVGSTVKLDGGGPIWAALAGGWNLLSRVGGLLAGSFIMVDRTVFQQLGGFSSQLFAAEEIDLSKRLREVGRAQRRKIVILHRTPLETSARKTELYSPREWFSFFVRSVVRPFSTLTRRDACSPWYDGRR